MLYEVITIGFQKPGADHGIKKWADELDATVVWSSENRQIKFEIMADFDRAGVCKDRLKCMDNCFHRKLARYQCPLNGPVPTRQVPGFPIIKADRYADQVGAQCVQRIGS